MKDKKSMAMIVIIGITIILFLCFNTTVFATTGTVSTSDLRLRKEESTSSQVLALLDENEKVEILGQNGDWYKVKANGKIGYVNKQYIKVKEENVISNDTTDQNNINKNNVDNNIKNEEQTTAETTTTDPTENETAENKQEEESKPEKGKFNSETDLKVAPLINAISMSTTKNNETYDIVITAGVWSYVNSSFNSGWVLTEKITKIEDKKAEEDKTEGSNKTGEDDKKTEDSKTEENKSTEKTYSSAKTYYVKGTSVNARSEANKSSEVVKVLNTNDSVKVTGEDGDWYIIKIDNKKAYVSKSLLSSKKVEVTSRSSTSLEESNKENVEQPVETVTKSETVASNPNGEAIIAYARNFLGYRYVYGTNGPNTFDCSGFVQYVYKHFGYSLSRSSSTQANDGVAVSKSNLQPGDILIFRDTSNSRIGHVGLYIGGGEFIHASNSKTGVIISSLSSASYQKRYVGARRIL